MKTAEYKLLLKTGCFKQLSRNLHKSKSMLIISISVKSKAEGRGWGWLCRNLNYGKRFSPIVGPKLTDLVKNLHGWGLK